MKNSQHYHYSNNSSIGKLPLVSILIPTYNRAKYLGEALNSALAQTYQNLEIIVHDDASTDETPNILGEYADPRLRVIRTENNHTMLGGWNYIVKQANGEYIKFLASDDLLDPTCVEELVKLGFANPGATILTCRRKFIDEEGRVIKKMGFHSSSITQSGLEHAHWILTTLRENKIGEPTAVMYRRDVVSKAGEYDPTFSQFADFEYWIRLLQFGDLAYVHKPLCYFRLHSGSNTSAAIEDGRFITEIFALLHKYYDNQAYSQAFNLTNSDYKKVLNIKTLDTIKNIKDLFVQGNIGRAQRYYKRLSKEVSLNSMTRATIGFILNSNT